MKSVNTLLRKLALILLLFGFVGVANATPIYYQDGGIHYIDFVLDDKIYVDKNPSENPTTVIVENGAWIRRIISYNSGIVQIHDGYVETLEGFDSSLFEIYGGSISCLMSRGFTRVNVRGGYVNNFSALGSGPINFWGGNFDEVFHRNGNVYGGTFYIFHGADTHIWGGEFDYIYATSSLPVYIYGRDLIWDGSWHGLLTGTWGDGTPFSCRVGYDSPDLIHLIELPKPVEIDIKPGSYPNCMNINGHGVIPVAVLGNEDFDVTTIDVSTLSFAGFSVRVRGKGPLCHLEDVSGDFSNPEGAPDGHLDLNCQFEDAAEQWQPGEGTADLTGFLLPEFGGKPIIGTDSICVVP
ncbi:hypothetical protein KA005_31050 [bacterium]|nr:hypothetical protein [bacterium]